MQFQLSLNEVSEILEEHKNEGIVRGYKKRRDAIISHLVNYKLRTLKIDRNGIWWRDKKEYSHILPKPLYERNIIDKGYKSKILDLIKIKDNNINKHLGFHHLNSSQALTLSLFGPLVLEHKISDLLNLFGFEHVDACRLSPRFEYIYDKKERTNFDFALIGIKNLFVEVKYTEYCFGKAKQDKKHTEKYNSCYQERLKQFIDITQEEFFKSYQLWRNICYTTEGTVAFVIPSFRTDLASRIESAKNKIQCPDKVKIVWIDDICEIGEKMKSDSLSEHYQEFRRKYLPDLSYR